MPRRLAIAVVALLALLLPCRSAAQTPEELFERGNELYQEGRFDEASAAYTMVLQYRIRDPRLEFNLGNTEFRRGRLGRAILHFERAYRLDPTDPEIRDNLAFARSFRFDRVDPAETFLAVEWLRGVQGRVGPDPQAWTVLGLIWLFCGLLVWSTSRPGRFRPAHGWLLAVVLLLVVLVGASWYATQQGLDGQQVAVVVEEAVAVLAGPGSGNPTLFTVHEGLTVDVLEIRDEWIHVSLPNRLIGWLPSGAVELV